MTSIKPKIASKTCTKCGTYLSSSYFYPTKSHFFPDGTLSICKNCLAEIIDIEEWATMDKFCQWTDYPFMPDIWTRLSVELGAKAFDAYVKGYCADEAYSTIKWKTMQDEWAKALKTGEYKDKIPVLSEAKIAELTHTWGKNYTPDELEYMENFYNGLHTSHNIITVTQEDSARKLAKLSVRISQKISRGDDIDKDISSYDKEMKIGGFTTENIRSMSDFESVGELISYLEKTGWRNPYYDDVPKDIVDETMANMQKYVHRLIMGESSLRDQVEQKFAALGINKAGTFEMSDADLDKYEDESYTIVEALVADGDEDDNQEMVIE